MADLVFVGSSGGIRSLLKSPGVQKTIKDRAEAVAAAARIAAPVKSGLLKRSIVVVPKTTPNRSMYRVVANTRYAKFIDSSYLVRSLDKAKIR